jgi:hypothetical protein
MLRLRRRVLCSLTIRDAARSSAFGWSRLASFSAAGRVVGPVDPFGFSCSLAVWLRNAREMAVGFPWILSSESRLINELYGSVVGKFSSLFLSGGANHRSQKANAQVSPSGKLSSISDFSEEIVVRALQNERFCCEVDGLAQAGRGGGDFCGLLRWLSRPPWTGGRGLEPLAPRSRASSRAPVSCSSPSPRTADGRRCAQARGSGRGSFRTSASPAMMVASTSVPRLTTKPRASSCRLTSAKSFVARPSLSIVWRNRQIEAWSGVSMSSGRPQKRRNDSRSLHRDRRACAIAAEERF